MINILLFRDAEVKNDVLFFCIVSSLIIHSSCIKPAHQKLTGTIITARGLFVSIHLTRDLQMANQLCINLVSVDEGQISTVKREGS